MAAPASETVLPHASARSSTATFAEPSSISEHHAHTPSRNGLSPLEREINRDELRMEEYGGDDVEPPEKGKERADSEPTTNGNQVAWDGPNDPTNPQNWSKKYKWFITVSCAIMTVNVTFASSSPTSAVEAIKAQFNISTEVTYLVTTVFLLGYMIGPLLWGPGSELVGRRPILVGAMSMYTIFMLGQALAQNIQTFLITRFICGFFAVAPLTISGGVIADIWSAAGRGPATSLFTASVFLGPVIGPIISGYIVESHLSWRWVIWVMMIFAGSCTTWVIFTIPETYAPVLLLKKAKKLRKEDPVVHKHLYAEHEKQDWSVMGVIHRTLFRPFHMLAMEPVLVLITIYLSLVYGLLYALFEAFPVIFVELRHFTIAQDGLIFIGVGIGTTLGAFINYRLTSHYPQLIEKWRGFPPPEQRLFGGMIGGPGLVVGAFWLGWTGQYPSIPWYVPALSTIPIGMSISLIFMSFMSYLVDTYLMYSASAFAANTVVRSAVAAAFPLFTTQMFGNLGVNWASTLLALIGLLLAPSPFFFYRFGPRVRMRSRFAPCIDLKIAKEFAEQEAKEKGETSV
ncbi:hypothetical protein H0H92_013935 [Tricholoma furcatifolium]|nr:hypothetical protein H0H92_013935 [Tricholoma furcatifolium]